MFIIFKHAVLNCTLKNGINDTLYAAYNCYLSTTFILRNKPMITMGLGQSWIYSVKSWRVQFTITDSLQSVH